MRTRTDPSKRIGRRRVLKPTQSLCIIAPGFNGGQGRYDWEFRITTTNFVVILLLHSTENERVKWKWWTWPSSSTLLNHNTNIKSYFCTREKKCWSSALKICLLFAYFLKTGNWISGYSATYILCTVCSIFYVYTHTVLLLMGEKKNIPFEVFLFVYF